MTVALYEFPLCEKVRNYLRLEQLFLQLHEASEPESSFQALQFFELLFDLIELVERLDLRVDFIRDIDSQEKNLIHWSQHPEIDSGALDQTLLQLKNLLTQIKLTKKLGASIKEERFLSSIRQRFAIPGGATSFDLPSLFCWIKQNSETKQTDIQRWIKHLSLVNDSIKIIMAFLRERGRFHQVVGKNGFYQGNVEDKVELVRVKCSNDHAYYPVLSGNTYRYGIKFMQLRPTEGSTGAIAEDISFEIARC
ncbi:cell division protein ZapD [Agaribacter marinus]|uniref:Cell division protein ZapD n=1 Tax=Agaribacter marinus TaxID=1431249 RepID=A0AA37SZV7_9ALTE|nr:cell division protein ZapD [Agaribacter marinus]GLR71051.1 cell division protein ZapD [Agaribacter marinus]